MFFYFYCRFVPKVRLRTQSFTNLSKDVKPVEKRDLMVGRSILFTESLSENIQEASNLDWSWQLGMVGHDTRSTGNWPGQRLSQFSLQTNLIVASSETLTGSQFMTSKSHVPWIIEPFNCTMVIYLPFVDSIAFSGYLVCKYTKRLGFKERSEQSLKLLGILLSILWKKEKN